MRQRKHDVAVRNRQKFPCSVAEPLVTCAAMALGAMTIAAGSVGNLLLAAMIALLYLGAERSSTACADVSEGFALLRRKHVPPTLQEFLSVLAEDVGDFRLGRTHRLRPSPSDCTTSITCRPSKGLTMALRVLFETCRYLAVVWRSACPSSS
jgi:hypothetical protein